MSHVVDVLVTSIVLVFFVTIAVFIMEFFVPLSIKSDFDTICNKYQVINEVNGGLTSQERNNLKSELIKLGVKNIKLNITRSDTVKYKEDIVFNVKGEYIKSHILKLFQRGEKVYQLDYYVVYPNTKIIN